MKKITLANVAESLNVSKTLVSLVLNGRGDEHGINKDTQSEVIKKVKELNYKPNQFARGLRIGKSNTIGLIVADISNSFYAKMCRSIEDTANKHDYNLIICSSDENSEKESKLIQMLTDRQVDGLIISTTQKNYDDIKLLKKSDFPFVLIDRNVTDIETNYVIVDNRAGAKKAVNHLIKSGKQKIGHLTITPTHLSTLKDRTQGYKDALKENGIKIDSKLIREISFENIKENVAKELKDLINNVEPIDSLFVANNNIAVACLEFLKDMKVRIPEELAMVSFDDIDVFKLYSPPITAVGQPIEEMGKEALNILIDQIKSSKKLKPKQVSLSTELRIRQSSDNSVIKK